MTAMQQEEEVATCYCHQQRRSNLVFAMQSFPDNGLINISSGSTKMGLIEHGC
jgi:hypothetical protein